MKKLLLGLALLASTVSFARVSDRDFKELVTRVEILEQAQSSTQISNLVGKKVGRKAFLYALTDSCEAIEAEGNKANSVGCAGPYNCSSNLHIRKIGKEFSCGNSDFVIVEGTLINDRNEEKTALGVVNKADIVDFDN